MKSFKKVQAGIFVMLFAFCVLFSSKVTAAEVNEVNLPLNNAWLTGEISVEGEVDFYKLSIPKAGWVTVTYQGFSVRDSYVQVLNSNMSRSYADANVWYTSDIAPKTKEFVLALEPGMYYVKVKGNGNNKGEYRLKGSFVAANNNESSNNNDFSTAMNLNVNQTITGFLSMDDTVDFFKITVPGRKGVRLIYTSYVYDSYLQVWNSDFIEIGKKEVWYASQTAPKTYVYEEVLDPGTYYIKIYPSGSSTGKYMLKYEEKVLVNSIKITGKKEVEAGKSIRLNATVSPSNATYKTINWISGDTQIATVDQNGKVTAHMAGKVNITAQSTDGGNKSKIYSVIVRPKKMSKPAAANVAKKKMHVSWYYQSGVSGYKIQYCKKKNFKGAKTVKVSKNSNYKRISKLSKTKYYVRVCAYYKAGKKMYDGKWSSPTSVRIRR